MGESNPLRSLTIDRSLLEYYATERAWVPNQREFAMITTKAHPTLPLAIHNYTDRAFWKQTWDNVAVAARMLVTESTTGKVVSRSFSKFFNYHEKLAYKPTGNEYAFAIEEKVDGSIISVFYYKGKWMIISRASFDSPHTQAAQNLLDMKYPGALQNLDKEKTYVFELIDPRMPIKVYYKKADLVLLSIVSKDGHEPPHDFDWTTLPFTRPRIHAAATVNPKELSKLNIENEEGFVVKFWQNPSDTYPERIKVKFERYLRPTERFGGSPSKTSINSSNSQPKPPSNADILELYTKYRKAIHHFNATLIAPKMDSYKQQFLRSLESIADDYGGEEWIRVIEKTWDRINALFALQEDDWRETTEALQREGYKPGQMKGANASAIGAFQKRIRKGGVDKSLREALVARFTGESPGKQVGLVVQNMEIPMDLRSKDTISLVG